MAKGVEFVDAVADHGYGLVTHFKVPGDFNVQLFQPRYSKKPSANGKAKKPKRKTVKKVVRKEVKKAVKRAVKKAKLR